MGYSLYSLTANSKNYGSLRSTSAIKYIVIHYTSNKTDKPKANCEYYRDTVVSASAHYYVGDTEVWKSVPDERIAWSVGGKKWSDCSTTGGGKLYGTATNANTISIEMTSNGGKFTTAMLNNTLALTRALMKKYGVSADRVIRHFDVNGKYCPGGLNTTTWGNWCGKNHEYDWNTFKNHLKNGTYYGTASSSSAPAPTEQKDSAKKEDSFMVRTKCELNVRKGPGTSYAVNCVAKVGSYTIVETSGSWGKLKSGAGWINISSKYADRI